MAGEPLFCDIDIKRSALQRCAISVDLGGVDFRRGLLGQCHLEFFEQNQEVLFGLCVTGQNNFTTVGGRQVDVEHLHSGKLYEHGSRRQAAGAGSQTTVRVTYRQ